jgi:hypothetical protein
MGSFEWMEVETLSTEITALESRLAAAKSRHNYGLVKVVKEQIAAAQQRRARYLAHITTSLAESLDSAVPAKTASEAPPALAGENREDIVEPDLPTAELPDATEVEEELADPVTEDVTEALAEPDQPSAQLADPVSADVPEQRAEPDQPNVEPADPIANSGGVARDTDTIGGVSGVWDRLTPGHIERAKHELSIRRVEMLTRHAAELRAQEADRNEIDALAQAIDAFVQKFNAPEAASVVRLDEQRDRLQIQA